MNYKTTLREWIIIGVGIVIGILAIAAPGCDRFFGW